MSTSELAPPVSEIRRLRSEKGLSMKQLADLLHVTPAAIQQYEKSEISGAIQLSTLRKAIAAMDADLTVQASPRKKRTASRAVRVTVPKGFASLAPIPHRPKERVIFRAKSRARTGAIVADAAIEGAPFTPSELWAIVEGATVGGRPIQAQHRVRSIRDGYDSMIRSVVTGEDLPALLAPGGAAVLPDSGIANAFVRALDMAARAIANGAAPTEARLSANALLLRNGIDSVALRVSDRQRHEDAVLALRTSGDASPFFTLMLDRYSEDD